MGWVTDEANKILEGKRDLQVARQWELHVAEVLKRDAPLFFERICEQIVRDATEFNQVHGDSDPIHHAQRDSKDYLEISRRSLYPHVLVELNLDPSGAQIRMRRSRQDGPIDERQVFKTVIRLTVDRQSQIFNDIEDISGLVLRPVIDAYRETA